MKRLPYILLLLCLAMTVSAQKKSSSVQKKTATTKTTVAKKQTATKPASSRQPARKQPAKQKQQTGKKQPVAKKQQPVTVKSLQNQRQQIQKNIQEQERRLRANERDVKQRLQNLMTINTEIADKRKIIDTIRHDITVLDGNIVELDKQLKVLENELESRKQRYMKSVRYMHRNRNIQSRLLFIFSANNFTQMYRRMRFMREYAAYQHAQGEAVKSMQAQVAEAVTELTTVKKQKNTLLNRGEQEKKELEGKQVEQQNVVTSLQKQQKTIQGIIDQQRKKDAELNAQIDKLVAEEIARAKARAEAERKRKAAEAAAKKRAEELARKKAAAEAAARENARRVAEAKAREEEAKAKARAAARKSAQERAAAERAARQAENARKAAERKAAADTKARNREMAEAKKNSRNDREYNVSSEDRRLSGNFESNRGRLPMPVTGACRIVNGFGQYAVEGLKGNVMLDNKGINIKGQPGASARCIFDGEVSAVGGYAGSLIVIIRHGNYLSVYCNLSSVSVSRGQKVSTRQTLGTIGGDGVMQFQLRYGKSLLNPEKWLSRR